MVQRMIDTDAVGCFWLPFPMKFEIGEPCFQSKWVRDILDECESSSNEQLAWDWALASYTKQLYTCFQGIWTYRDIEQQVCHGSWRKKHTSFWWWTDDMWSQWFCRFAEDDPIGRKKTLWERLCRGTYAPCIVDLELHLQVCNPIIGMEFFSLNPWM